MSRIGAAFNFSSVGAMPFDVLTKQEAAERAKISRTMLDKQIRAGTGPAVTRIGGSVRVRSDELQAWLERCTVPQQGATA